MNYNIEINTTTIREFSKGIIQEGTNFITLLEKFKSEVEKMEECFETETGKLLKKRLLEIVDNNKKTINDKYISYSKVIDNIANIYDDVDEEIKKNVKE